MFIQFPVFVVFLLILNTVQMYVLWEDYHYRELEHRYQQFIILPKW